MTLVGSVGPSSPTRLPKWKHAAHGDCGDVRRGICGARSTTGVVVPHIGNADLLDQPAEMLVTYLAVFFYGTVSGGRAPDGRPVLEALHADVRHLRDLVGQQAG